MIQKLVNSLFPNGTIHEGLRLVFRRAGLELPNDAGIQTISDMIGQYTTRSLERDKTGRPLETIWDADGTSATAFPLIAEVTQELGLFDAVSLPETHKETEMLVCMGGSFSNMKRALTAHHKQCNTFGKLYILANTAQHFFSGEEYSLMKRVSNEANLAHLLLSHMPMKASTYSFDVSMVYSEGENPTEVDEDRVAGLMEQYDAQGFNVVFALQGLIGWRQQLTIARVLRKLEVGFDPIYTIAPDKPSVHMGVPTLNELAALIKELALVHDNAKVPTVA